MNNKPIRIKKWEDLDGAENELYHIAVVKTFIVWCSKQNYEIIGKFKHSHLTQDTILSILRQFGFEVEFEKQVELTETDKDDVKFCLRHNLHYVAKNYNDIVSAFTNKPVRGIDYWFDPNTSGDIIPLNCGFSFLTWEHEPLYLDDLEV